MPDVLPSLTALVVDDAVDSAMLLARVLRMLDFDVQVAHEARTALAIVAAGAPRFIFLDIGLPEMDGSELAKQLRAFPGAKSSTIVAVSGFPAPAGQEAVRAMGFDRYVTKPISVPGIRALAKSLVAEISVENRGTDRDAAL